MTRPPSTLTLFALVVTGTILGIAGTDLVLPAVPSLPEALGGSVALAQFVLAAYAFGTLLGLLSFGELGARFDPRNLLVWSLGLFTLTSAAAALAPTLEWLIALRFAQGAFGSGAAVFAPGFIHGLYQSDKAAAAIGRLGSIESLTPALAPIAGAYLLVVGGWQLSFVVLTALGVIVSVVTWACRGALPEREHAVERHRSYFSIVVDGLFLRYALSQACALGGLLVFVFGAPAVLTGPLGMEIRHFVILQVCGIAMFIVAANLSTGIARRFGTERVLMIGTAIMPLSFLLLLIYALTGGESLLMIVPLWILVNGGFGIRGPIGFHQAILAAKGDHSRGAAVVVAAILGTAALGTAIVAPYVEVGLWPLALVSGLITLLGHLGLRYLGRGGRHAAQLG